MPSTGFIYRGDVTISFGNDFNNCSRPGYYRLDSAKDAKNSPGYLWGGMLVINCGNYIYQLAFCTNPVKCGFRTSDGVWSDWKTIGG